MSALEEAKERRAAMEGDLRRALDRADTLAKRHQRGGLAILFFAVAASTVAGILGLLEIDSRLVGLIALAPSLLTLWATTFKFQEKANWYYTRRVHLHALFNRLMFTGPAATEGNASALLAIMDWIANDWSKLNLTSHEVWQKDLQANWATFATSQTNAAPPNGKHGE